VGIQHAAYLLTSLSVSPKIWIWHLLAQEPFCFLNVTWHGEALYRLGSQGIGVLILLGFFLPSGLQHLSKIFDLWSSHFVSAL
jgi:hypothetical protein